MDSAHYFHIIVLTHIQYTRIEILYTSLNLPVVLLEQDKRQRFS